MFLEKTCKHNLKLIDISKKLHQDKIIPPDTYVIDLLQFKQNAIDMLHEANKYNIELYFMLKQIGRNPLLAKSLIELGYKGAVVVDFNEAKLMIDNLIPIYNVGHLVQIPKYYMEKFIEYGCKYYTVYSYEKIFEINEVSKKLNKVSNIMLKIIDDNDCVYPGQTSGFELDELENIVNKCKDFKNININAVTSFPCFLYNQEENKILPTNNLYTLQRAKSILENLGLKIENVNAPSATCTHILKELKQYGVNSAEPGHGLSGTTPMHALNDLIEKPCVIYLSEISHNYKDKSYCYGGGHYRRSKVKNALVIDDSDSNILKKVIPPESSNIDYYFELDSNSKVNSTVIMSFRFQIFVTRSLVCILKSYENEELEFYTSQGEKIQ